MEVENVLINETSKATNLTKKAIVYYTEQQLVSPAILENGYRDYNETDISRLKEICIFRKLGLSTAQIKVVLQNKSYEVLQKLCAQKELTLQRERTKRGILEHLGSGKTYDEIEAELKTLEDSETITEKLLNTFPGYYGRFVCLHFARFLNQPISTPQQQEAYNEIISFLDNIPSFDFPEDLKDFLYESTKNIETETIIQLLENTKQSIKNPEQFISNNKEMLKEYLAFKQSEEYLTSPIFQIQKLMAEFNQASGYNDVFIPAMIKISPSYAEYYNQLQTANQKLIEQFPEIAHLNQYKD